MNCNYDIIVIMNAVPVIDYARRTVKVYELCEIFF